MKDTTEPDDPVAAQAEAEGLALYLRLREEARLRVLATAAVLVALPGDLPRRAICTITFLALVAVRDTVAMSTGQETYTEIAVACVAAACQAISEAATGAAI